jgi:ABC-type nitrate/sulfonate/bicarbonate transport system ATPase subunit
VVLMSASPGRVNREWIIDLPWPRDPASSRITQLKEQMMARLQTCSCAAGSPQPTFIRMDVPTEDVEQ